LISPCATRGQQDDQIAHNWTASTSDATVARNRLTNTALDPFGKIPEFKYCAARVDAVSASQRAAE
jgi:hypothetical protein